LRDKEQGSGPIGRFETCQPWAGHVLVPIPGAADTALIVDQSDA
jgi:hypothetical protein